MPQIRELVSLPPGFFDAVLSPDTPDRPTGRPGRQPQRQATGQAPGPPTGDADTRPARPMPRRRVTSPDLYAGTGRMGDATRVRASGAPYNVANEYGRRRVTTWRADDIHIRPRPTLNRF